MKNVLHCEWKYHLCIPRKGIARPQSRCPCCGSRSLMPLGNVMTRGQSLPLRNWNMWAKGNEKCLALQRKSHLCIIRNGIARPQSRFAHSGVGELFIYSQDRFTYFPSSYLFISPRRAYIFRVFFYDTTLHNFYNDDITAQNWQWERLFKKKNAAKSRRAPTDWCSRIGRRFIYSQDRSTYFPAAE